MQEANVRHYERAIYFQDIVALKVRGQFKNRECHKRKGEMRERERRKQSKRLKAATERSMRL